MLVIASKARVLSFSNKHNWLNIRTLEGLLKSNNWYIELFVFEFVCLTTIKSHNSMYERLWSSVYHRRDDLISRSRSRSSGLNSLNHVVDVLQYSVYLFLLIFFLL